MTGLGTVFLSELFGTATLTLLGCGVVANALLGKSKGFGAGNVMITFGWGLAVFAGVYVASKSGAHLNPAVTLGQWTSGADVYAPGVKVTVASTLTYFGGEFLGAFIGAILCWAAYKQHYDDPGATADEKAATFATAPAIRNPFWNMTTEAIGTFVLVYVILNFGGTPSGLGPLAVALLVVGIGMSLGGPTGYAINPARDLGPRIAHAVLPIKGKGGSDWGYAWIPIAGPILGGMIAGIAANLLPIVA